MNTFIVRPFRVGLGLLVLLLYCVSWCEAVPTTVLGQVKDASNNQACPGAWVSCNAVGNSVYANSQGFYLIENFELSGTATYASLSATKTGYAFFYDYVAIQAGASNTITVNIYLGSLVSGRITTHQTGSPSVDGATLTAQSTKTVYLYSTTDGTYSVRLPPGSPQLWVRKDNFATSLKRRMTLVDKTDYPNTDFQLYVGGTITGHVYYGDTAIPVNSTNVECKGPNSWPAVYTTTDGSGYYSLQHVYPQYSVLTANSPNTQWLDAERGDVLVQDGATTGNLDLRLDPAGSLSGTITSYAGTPLQSVSLSCKRTGFPDELYSYNANTNSSGFYSRPSLPEGDYDIQVTPPQGLNLQSTHVSRVSVLSTQPAMRNFTLQAGGILEGHVYGVSGNTLVAASVSLYKDTQYPLNSLIQADTDTAGYFRFDGLTPFQKYTLSATPDTSNTSNAGAVLRELTISENETRSLTVALGLGGTIEGSVSNFQSQPFSGMALGLFLNASQIFVRYLASSPLSFSGIQEGNYYLVILPMLSDPVVAPALSTHTLVSGQKELKDFVLEAGSTLSGQIFYREAGGNTRPARGVKVFAKNPNALLGTFANLLSDDTTDSSGQYTIEYLPAGPHDVVICPPLADTAGYASVYAQADLASGLTTTLNVYLTQPGVKVHGVLRDDRGNLYRDGLVYFWDTTGIRYFAETDELGNYYIMLKPGTYLTQGFYPSMLGGNLAVNPTPNVQVLDGQPLQHDFVLEKGGSASGRITDQLGHGISCVQICAWEEGNPTPRRFGLTDTQGSYTITGLHTAHYRLEASAQGYATAASTFSITLGEETTDIRAILVAQTTISGVVHARGNQPVEDARVSLLSTDGQQVLLQTQPDKQGNYLLSPCTGGPYAVKATALGMKSSTALGHYAGAQVDFVLEPLISKDEAISYPNPCRGRIVTFLYWLEQEGTALIRVYNQAGELVWDWEGFGPAQQYQRQTWDVSGVAPGVYLFKVSNRTQTGEVKTFPLGKLTVIK